MNNIDAKTPQNVAKINCKWPLPLHSACTYVHNIYGKKMKKKKNDKKNVSIA